MEKIYVYDLPEDANKTKIIQNLVKKNKLEVELIYKSSFPITKNLRDFIEVIWSVFDIEPLTRSRLVLISDELNNNAIEYGTSTWWLNILRVKIEKKKKTCNLNFEVEDDWKWKAAKTALEMETLRAHQLKKWYGEHDSIRWRLFSFLRLNCLNKKRN